jgi:hypothetical protein
MDDVSAKNAKEGDRQAPRAGAPNIPKPTDAGDTAGKLAGFTGARAPNIPKAADATEKPGGPVKVSPIPRKPVAPAHTLQPRRVDAAASVPRSVGVRSPAAKPPPAPVAKSVGQQLIDALASAQQSSALQAVQQQTQRKLQKNQPDPLAFRRTIIPVLFTIAFILLCAAGYLLFSGEDNALVDVFPGWTPFVLLAAAAVSAGAGAINVHSVKRAMT